MVEPVTTPTPLLPAGRDSGGCSGDRSLSLSLLLGRQSSKTASLQGPVVSVDNSWGKAVFVAGAWQCRASLFCRRTLDGSFHTGSTCNRACTGKQEIKKSLPGCTVQNALERALRTPPCPPRTTACTRTNGRLVERVAVGLSGMLHYGLGQVLNRAFL